jgi:hypothetical protein
MSARPWALIGVAGAILLLLAAGRALEIAASSPGGAPLVGAGAQVAVAIEGTLWGDRPPEDRSRGHSRGGAWARGTEQAGGAMSRLRGPSGAEGVASSVRKASAAEQSRRSWPYFERVEAVAGRVSTRVFGIDPGAPRPLELWRVGEPPLRVAATFSLPSGRFDFGQQLVPQRGVRLQVVPRGASGPLARGAPNASRVTLRYQASD